MVVDGGALLLSWAELTRGRARLRGGGLALDPLRSREMTAAIKMYVGGRCMFLSFIVWRFLMIDVCAYGRCVERRKWKIDIADFVTYHLDCFLVW